MLLGATLYYPFVQAQPLNVVKGHRGIKRKAGEMEWRTSGSQESRGRQLYGLVCCFVPENYLHEAIFFLKPISLVLWERVCLGF